MPIIGPSQGATSGGGTVLSPPRLIKSITTGTPPISPSAGDAYIIPAGATGDWSAHVGDIAQWSGSVWTYLDPSESWFAYVDDEDTYYLYTGSTWETIGESAPPALHASTHEDGGADEISVAGLSGVLADAQTPAAHAAAHEAGGADLLDANSIGARELTGFENRTDSTIGMNVSNFEIAPAVTSFTFWSGGTKYTKSGTDSVAISNDQALHYVYYDTSGVLQVSTTPWDIKSNNIPVATVYKDGSDYVVNDERHSFNRDRNFHEWAHNTIGTRYESGLTGAFTDTTFSVAQGVIHDEDIDFDTGGAKTNCSRWYRNSGLTSMRVELGAIEIYKTTNPGVDNTINYDNAGTLTPAPNNRYVNHYVFATSCPDYPIVSVIGQDEHALIAAARSEALPQILLSTAEWKLLYRVTYQNVGGTPTYIEAEDYRQVSTGPATDAVATDHSGLVGRDAANSHPADAISFAPTGSIVATDVQAAIAEVAADAGVWTGVQVYYVGKHGNDSNEGKTLEKAFLTIGAAITAAEAQTPSASNRFAIVVLDSGVYTEALTISSWLYLHAPMAKIIGTVQMNTNDEAALTIHTIERTSATTFAKLGTGIGYLKAAKLSGINSGSICANYDGGTLYVDVDQITGTNVCDGLVNSDGNIYGRIGSISVVSGQAVLTSTSADIIDVSIGYIDVSNSAGNAFQSAAGSGKYSLSVGAITGVASGTGILHGFGTLHLRVGELSGFTTAYNISGSANFHLLAANLSGTETNTSSGTVNITKAGVTAAHKDSHKSGGSDAFAAADILEATIKRIQTTNGPTTLLVGDVADGKFLKRLSTGIVGVDVSDLNWNPSPAVNQTGYGIKATDTVGENVAFGDLLYMKSDGKYWKADADAAATMPGVVMAFATILADATGILLHKGYVRDDAWNWTVGGLIYADTTAGALTQTKPSGAGDQVQVVGYAVTADIMYFDPQLVEEVSTTQNIIVPVSDENSDLSTGTAKITFRAPYAMTLSAVKASVNVAPTGSVLTVDINESGSSILSTKLTIDAGEKTSETAATPPVISDANIAADAEITIDIDGVGSTIPGAGLKVTLIGVKA